MAKKAFATYLIRKILLIVIVLGLVAGGVYGFLSIDTNKGLHTLAGQELTIEEITSEAPVVVIVYWHSSCQYCADQIKVLNGLQVFFDYYYAQTGKGLGFVVGINVKDKDSAVQRYWSIMSPKFPTLAGGTPPTNATPVTEIYVSGQLKKQFVGLVTYEQLALAIEEIFDV